MVARSAGTGSLQSGDCPAFRPVDFLYSLGKVKFTLTMADDIEEGGLTVVVYAVAGYETAIVSALLEELGFVCIIKS